MCVKFIECQNNNIHDKIESDEGKCDEKIDERAYVGMIISFFFYKYF